MRKPVVDYSQFRFSKINTPQFSHLLKKVWNTSGGTGGTEAVTIDLLRNGNVVRTATLDKDNNWQVIYTDMPESDAYSIKEVNIPKGFTATYKQEGDVVTFTDVKGVTHYYEVVLLETLPKDATKEMIASDFDLSLYTCTTGGGSRVTVRCRAVDGNSVSFPSLSPCDFQLKVLS